MLTPCFRLTLHLAKYPPTEGTTTYRWSQRPLADAGAWSEGRLISLGEVSRSCTDQDGNYEVASVTVELADDDALFRTLLNVSTTQYILGREALLELLSETGRATALAWRPVFRGTIAGVQLTPGRRVSLTLSDMIGSKFSNFGLEREIGVKIGAEHINLPEDSKGRMYPIIVGEHSDVGRVDAAGTNIEKGVLPVIDLGDYDVGGSPEPPDFAGPPIIDSATVVGSAGDDTHYYAVSCITALGESLRSETVVVTNAPSTAEMSINRYVRMEGSYDPGPEGTNRVRIWGRRTNPASKWLDSANHHNATSKRWGYLDGAANFPSPYRNELDMEKSGKKIGVVSTALQSDTIWGHLLVSLGQTEVHEVYWSDLAEDDAKRVLADPALEAIEYMTSSSPAWPYPHAYLETGGIRYTVILVRGPRLNAHRDGGITIAVNGCGMEDVGDGTGEMVADAFRAGQLFLNEHILKDGGLGYRTGDYGPLEEFSNGDVQVWTSAWTAAQDITIARIGGTGYQAAWAIYDPVTVREWIRRFCFTFDCRLAVNHFGQLYPVLIDDLADAAGGRLYREREESVVLEDQALAHEDLENRIVYAFDYDHDAQVFRMLEQTVEDRESQAAHIPGGIFGAANLLGIYQGDLQELWYTRDPATAADSRGRRLTRNKQAPRYLTHRQDLRGVEDDLGAAIRVTHRDGLGATGDLATPCCVLKHVVRPWGEIGTTLTVMDVGRLLSNDTTMTDDGFIMTADGPEMR